MRCGPPSSVPTPASSSTRSGSLADVPDAELALLFVTHSIPDTMDETSGPGDGEGRLYQEQHHALAHQVVDQVQRELGRDLAPEVVYCSRSGPPTQPWLEPDVNDRLEELAAEGRRVVVLAPVGFVSDHMEVAYDLDTEAAETAERLGVGWSGYPRSASTRPSSPASSTSLEERAAEARGERWCPPGPASAPRSARPAAAPTCAQARPALCGSD